MPNYLPNAEDIRDAMRYRRFRELLEYGEFFGLQQSMEPETKIEAASEIDYAHELDAALDDPKLIELGDALIRLREKKARESLGVSTDSTKEKT